LTVLAVLAPACGLLGPAPTPTLVPQQLPDPAMQQVALAAVQAYAKQLDYAYRQVSLSILGNQADQVAIHATVSLQTRKGFPYEEYDALFVMRKTSAGWEAEPIKKFSKLEWEVALQRGPLTLKSPAGFDIQVPAGWVGHAATESALRSAAQCGTGLQPIASEPILLIMPAGYSADNVPVILRAYQQCPRAPALSAIRQTIERIRDTDKDLTFHQLELKEWAGRPALIAVMSDASGTIAYDFYVMHRERQLEFVVQAYPGQDATPALNALNRILFN
jgi:hypothetical protein